ncbi:MAG: hypothetical protein IKP61_08745 [Spirochaetales bacterium]|nr:hypothetical protein [Spirochaetales bacterium]
MTKRILGNPDSKTVLIQMVDDHDLEVIESEYQHIRSLAPEKDFSLLTLKVNDWNGDLSPWTAPPVFGNVPFGDGAPKTLSNLLNELPKTEELYIGGYSLSGLFALWASFNCSVFRGVAAVSPSVWFPGFVDYTKANTPQTGAVYLSLGDKEEKTRNTVMATVGTSIRQLHDIFREKEIPCILEWNEGNHFYQPDVRMARGFAWLLNQP